MRAETVPLVVVALLLLSAQPGVETVTTVFEGATELPGESDAVLVTGGTVTVPADERVSTSVYVVAGTAQIEGTLDGRLVQFAGNVAVGPTGAVTGVYRAYGGERAVAEGADVTTDVVAEPLTARRSPGEAFALFVLQTAALAAVAFAVGRRYADLLDNVGRAVRHHPVVSGTVGLLGTVTLLALFVFMAFTIVLVPVSLLGLFGGALVFLYAYVALGYVVGRAVQERFAPTARPGLATAGGTAAVAVATRALGFVPVVGGLVPVAVLLVAVGAVFVTYFGLREFHPPELRPVE